MDKYLKRKRIDMREDFGNRFSEGVLSTCNLNKYEIEQLIKEGLKLKKVYLMEKQGCEPESPPETMAGQGGGGITATD